MTVIQIEEYRELATSMVKTNKNPAHRDYREFGRIILELIREIDHAEQELSNWEKRCKSCSDEDESPMKTALRKEIEERLRRNGNV